MMFYCIFNGINTFHNKIIARVEKETTKPQSSGFVVIHDIIFKPQIALWSEKLCRRLLLGVSLAYTINYHSMNWLHWHIQKK